MSVTPEQQTKKILVQWIRLMKSDERYYFPKAMRLFYEIPGAYQRALILWFGAKEEQNKWLDKAEDTTQYPDVIRSILFYYSGRKEFDEPYKQQLAVNFGEFLKSDEFKEAGEAIAAGKFVEALETI